jgi:hypothetical protein
VSAPPPRDLLRAALGQVGRVTLVPERDVARAPWPGALVVATGIALGAAAWLAGRLLGALGAAPALAGLAAVTVAVVLGAAVVERGVHAAMERWIGARWASLVVGAVVLARVVALWSLAPRVWLGALIVSVAAGRWIAVGLQRLGDVAAPGRGRTLVVERVGWPELGLASLVVVACLISIAGAAGAAIVIAVVVISVALGLGVQILDRELAGDSLAAVAAVAELVVLIGLAAYAPAAASPFIR